MAVGATQASFAQAGNYTITASVTDPDGLNDSETVRLRSNKL